MVWALGSGPAGPYKIVVVDWFHLFNMAWGLDLVLSSWYKMYH